jgi:Zn-dependent protease with chaperone function
MELGEWVHDEIVRELVVERDGWAWDMVQRVDERVQGREEPRKVPVLVWGRYASAFTLPGRYIYLTRQLLEEPLPEDAIALVFGHELAHQRLHHVDRYLRYLRHTRALRKVGVGAIIALAFQRAHGAMFSTEDETAADAWALDRCVAAGYRGEKCLELFPILEKISLDHRDVDGVYGTDAELAELEPNDREPKQPPSLPAPAMRALGRVGGLLQTKLSGMVGQAKKLRGQLGRSHPSLRARRAHLEDLLHQRRTR